MREKITFVLIHGAGGGGWEYDLWKPVFEKAGHKFIAKDLMPADGGLAKTTLDDYVRQVIAQIPRGEPVVLVGASMGGVLALKAAEQVKPVAIVLVNSVPPANVGPSRPPREPIPAVMRWANGPLKDTQDSMPDSDEKTILWAWKKWRDESGTVMNALYGGVPARKQECPVLVVLGEKDTDVRYSTGQAIAEWASADVILYRGMSHVGPLLSRRATEVADTTRQWCESRLSR